MKEPLPQPSADQAVDALYQDIRQRVEQARAQVLTQGNQALVTDLCSLSRWPVRTLRKRMDGLLFERTAIAKALVEARARLECTPGVESNG